MTMPELDRRVTGDWFEIRAAGKEYDTLNGYFKIPEHYQRMQIEKLEFAVEQGILEYKRTSLSPLFSILENARYSSPSFESLKRQIDYTSAVLFVMLLQRLFADGTLHVAREKRQEHTVTPGELDLKNVLRDIGARIKDAPELNKNPSVKAVLLQAGQLRKERDNMQKLLPMIREETRQTFLDNYKKTFGEIVEKIKRHYIALLQEEMPDLNRAKPVLMAADLRKTLKNLNMQCEAVSRLRSTLLFVAEEKYKIREIMVKLAQEKAPFLELLSQEGQLSEQIVSAIPAGQVEGDPSVTRAYCREIIRFLEKHLSYTGMR